MYRLTIMLGTLTVGSMAAYRYGPEPESLAGIINEAVRTIGAGSGPAEATLADAPSHEAPSYEATSGLLPLGAAPVDTLPRFDAQVQQAAALMPLEEGAPTPPAEGLDRDRLVAPLIAAGATEADVTAWGHGDRTVYRATASAPVSADAPDLERRFDAVGETPEDAVARLAAEVREAGLR